MITKYRITGRPLRQTNRISKVPGQNGRFGQVDRDFDGVVRSSVFELFEHRVKKKKKISKHTKYYRHTSKNSPTTQSTNNQIVRCVV